MKTESAEWSKLVKSGRLEEGYNLYKNHNTFHRFSKKISLRISSSIFSSILFFFTRLNKRSFDIHDNAIDLSEEFLLFWKCPNIIGRMLVKKIVSKRLRGKPLPARALGWYAHWLVFQGRNKQACRIFRVLLLKTEKDSRLKGEIYSLIGNYFYSRNKLSYSIHFHEKADEILRRQGDKFFQMFNLGSAAKTYTEHADTLKFKKLILNRFDHLNPQEPDERYGMRILIYYAYLNLCDGNIERGKHFYITAEKSYSKSGSSLDKSIFCAFKSIILIFFRDLKGANDSIKLAKKHLSDFGCYKTYEALIVSIERHLKYGDSNNQLIQQLLGANLQHNVSALESWYKNFFSTMLPLIENFQSKPLEQFVLDFESISDSKITSVKLDANVSHKEINSAVFCIHDQLDEFVTFSFHLFHQGEQYLFSLKSNFKKWRNPDIFEAIRSTLFMLHNSSKQDQLNRIAHIQDNKLKEAETARRIAHDIKSPLAALQVVLKDLDPQINDFHIIKASTQKIEDIVHGLNKQNTKNSNEIKKVLSRSFFDSFIADKRLEYSSSEVEITLRYDDEGASSFVEVNELELYRNLSNVINNAIEAQPAHARVNITINKEIGYLSIRIQDYGEGIPVSRLSEIFKKDVSFKENGTGLGLYYAKDFFENNGGEISVEGTGPNGTTFKLKLPLASPPIWLKTTLFLHNYTRIVIADDFLPNIEMMRKKILKDLPLVNIVTFTSLNDFSYFLSSESTSDTFFIIDFDFGTDQVSGIDLIIEKDLANRAVIATHHFEDEIFRAGAINSNVSVIPKIIFNDIKIVSKQPIVHIVDDDKYFLYAIRDKLKARFAVKTYQDPRSLLSDSVQINSHDYCFIDQRYDGIEIKGEEVLSRLRSLGHFNLYNTSGDDLFYDKNSVKIKKTEIEALFS